MYIDHFSLLKGFAGNLLITVLSFIFPFIIGTVFNILANKFKLADTISNWISLPIEILCPVTLFPLCYFVLFPSGKKIVSFLIIIIVMTITHLGYMPARHNKDKSILYNILYNGLGLISSLFKWSFCVGIINVMDILEVASVYLSRTYNSSYYWIPVIASTLTLFVIETARKLIKQFVK